MNLRIDEELDTALTELAAAEGLSKQEIVHRAVLERYQRTQHRDRLERASDELLGRWGDLLDRLGSV